MKQRLITLLFCCFSCSLIAQNECRLEGVVTDIQTGEPLVGAIIKSGNQVSLTDSIGNYTFPTTFPRTIEVNYIGYDKWVLELGGCENGELVLNIPLKSTVNLLQTATVTAGKYEKELAKVTVSIDVLQASLVANTNTRRIDEVLQKAVGVNIVDGQANIRGGSGYSYGAGSRVLLLIDDIPALQADAGFPNWKDVAVENIAQIEVVKGAASALYGSSAMNGIINIRTDYAKNDPVTVVSTFGTGYLAPRDSRKNWYKGELPHEFGTSVSHKQRLGRLDVVATGYYLNQNSFNKGIFDRYGRFSTNLRYRIRPNLSIGLNFNINKGNSGSFFYYKNSDSLAFVGADATLTQNKRLRYTLDPYAIYTDSAGNKVKFLGRIYSIRNEVSGGRNNFSTLYYGEFQYQRQFLKDKSLTLTTGIVGMGTSTNAQLYGDTTYTSRNLGAYLQIEKEFFKKLTLSAGARYEQNELRSPEIITIRPASQFQTAIYDTLPNKGRSREGKPVYRIGASYQVAKATFLRSSYGEGYRYPTVAEKFIATDGGGFRIYPNPRLVSETGWTAEIGLKQGFQFGGLKGYVDVAIFQSEYQNMMEFGLNGQLFGFQSNNVGNTRIKGIEGSIIGQGTWGNTFHTFLMGYTYINPTYQNFTPEDSITNSAGYNVLKYRYRHNVKFDYETTIKGKFSVGLSVQHISNMEAIDNVFHFVIQGLKTYRTEHNRGAVVTDLRLAYRPNKHLKITTILANALNEEYTYRPGLLEAPRNLSLRVDYRF